MSRIHHFATIADLQGRMDHSVNRNPLFAIVPIEEVRGRIGNMPTRFTYAFYGIGLKKNLAGYVKYGRRKYDFREGVLSFTAPNQVLSFDRLIADGSTGWYVFFHRAILGRSAARIDLTRLSFFNYEVSEALHLSGEEESAVEAIMEGLYREYMQPIDRFGREVVASNLNLLFSYAKRYYARQFITRHNVESDFLQRFEAVLAAALTPERLAISGIPKVSLLAERMNVSPNYLSDLLKSLTGKSTLNHLHFHLIERGKELILSSDKPISEIAYELGFGYPQHFSKLFKEKTQLSPTAFRDGEEYLQ